MAYLVYDINASGRITLPPIERGESCPSTPPRKGYDRRECNTIREVEKIEKILQRQTFDEREKQAEVDANTFLELKRQVRRNIITAIESSSTDQYTKDFLKAWCELRDEKRRDHYANILRQRECYIEALHNDSPRPPDVMLKEDVSI